MIRVSLCAAVLAAASMAPVAAHDGGDEHVTVVYDQKLPNVPGKSMKGVLVEYAPGGTSPAHTPRTPPSSTQPSSKVRSAAR
jgi:quercetin dioxygenase-like cupin family protein